MLYKLQQKRLAHNKNSKIKKKKKTNTTATTTITTTATEAHRKYPVWIFNKFDSLKGISHNLVRIYTRTSY